MSLLFAATASAVFAHSCESIAVVVTISEKIAAITAINPQDSKGWP